MALELSTKIPEVKDVIGELSADEKLRREAFYSILKIEFLTNKKLDVDINTEFLV